MIEYFSTLTTRIAEAPANLTPETTKVNASPILLTTSYFTSEIDNNPVTKQLTWEEIKNTLSKHINRGSKKGSLAWSPVSYKPNTTRSNKGVENVYLAVLDIDNGTPVEDMRTNLLGYEALIYTSYSYTVDHPKYRVVLPLANPVPADQWPVAWEKVNIHFGGYNDPATKDVARIYFVPIKHPDSQDHFVETLEGSWLDVDSLPNLPCKIVSRVAPESSTTGRFKKAHIEGIELSPRKGLDEVVSRCKFMAVTSAPERQPHVSEPLWMAELTNACLFENSEPWIYEASCNHPAYDKNDTAKRIARYRSKAAPVTCERIRILGFTECPEGGCKLPSGQVTKAPAGLWSWMLPKSDKGVEFGIEGGMPEDIEDFCRGYYPLRYVNGSFQGYQEGYWPQLDDKADVRKAIARFLGKRAKAKNVSEVFTLLSDFKAEKELTSPENNALICLSNGSLDTKTYVLSEHKPEHRLKTKTNILWDPKATCPRWLQFLNEIFEFDTDKEEKIVFVQEWLGYCLVPDNSQHKFVWMVGGGGNGKSVLLNVLTRLAGEANVSHAYIERLDEKFVRAELEGKLVNISPEMSAEATVSDGYLKAIVSGDIIEAERKFKPSFSFRPFVKLVAATNNMPRLLDLTEGFFRRAIVLGFNRQFAGAQCDPHLEDKLKKELPGILVWAVDGLHRLRERGHFITPHSSLVSLNQYRVDNDPVKQFIEESLLVSEANRLAPIQIYEVYSQWSRGCGYSPKNIAGFGKRLTELGFSKGRSGGKDYWKVAFKECESPSEKAMDLFLLHDRKDASNNILPLKPPIHNTTSARRVWSV